MEKKGLILASLLFLTNAVCAYGESSGLLVGNMYLDINLIISVGIFMLIFVTMSIATRKIKLFHTEGARIFISFVISLFSIYGLSKANVDYETLFIDWGIQQLLMDYGAWILLVSILAVIWIWNIRTLILIASGAFIVMGFTGMANKDIVYNWSVSLMIGIILLLIYLWLKKRGGFKFNKVKITPGMAILGIHTVKGEEKLADGKTIQIEMNYRDTTKIYIKNNGVADLEWRAVVPRGLRMATTHDTISKDMYSVTGIKKVSDDANIREVIIYGKSIGEKKGQNQHVVIQILPKGSGLKTITSTPQKNDRQRLEIQTQYNKYSNRIQEILKKYNRKIPNANGATNEEKKDSREYSSLANAMKRLENIARKNGLILR